MTNYEEMTYNWIEDANTIEELLDYHIMLLHEFERAFERRADQIKEGAGDREH